MPILHLPTGLAHYRRPNARQVAVVLASVLAAAGLIGFIGGVRTAERPATSAGLEQMVAQARLAYIEEPNDWELALRYARLQCHLLEARQLARASRPPYRARFIPDPELEAIHHRLQNMSQTQEQASELAELEVRLNALEMGEPPDTSLPTR